MRPFLPLFLSVVTGPAFGQGLDCAVLTSTDQPFAVTYEVATRAADGTVSTAIQQVQVFRQRSGKASRVTIYTVQSPGMYLRTRGPNLLFPLESYYSTEPQAPRTWAYSVDPASNYLALRQPLSYSADMKGPAGQLFLSARMMLTVGESAAQRLGGCHFDAVRIRRTMDGLADRQPVGHRREGWVVPALQIELHSTLRTGDIEVIYTPTAITGDFKRVE